MLGGGQRDPRSSQLTRRAAGKSGDLCAVHARYHQQVRRVSSRNGSVRAGGYVRVEIVKQPTMSPRCFRTRAHASPRAPSDPDFPAACTDKLFQHARRRPSPR